MDLMLSLSRQRGLEGGLAQSAPGAGVGGVTGGRWEEWEWAVHR